MKTIRYRLYELPHGPDGEAAVERAQYYRITPGRVLVYTKGRKPPGGRLVEDVAQLSGEEVKWLAECGRLAAEAFAKEHAEGAQAGIRRFVEQLDEELKHEEKMKGEKSG